MKFGRRDDSLSLSISIAWPEEITHLAGFACNPLDDECAADEGEKRRGRWNRGNKNVGNAHCAPERIRPWRSTRTHTHTHTRRERERDTKKHRHHIWPSWVLTLQSQRTSATILIDATHTMLRSVWRLNRAANQPPCTRSRTRNTVGSRIPWIFMRTGNWVPRRLSANWNESHRHRRFSRHVFESFFSGEQQGTGWI